MTSRTIVFFGSGPVAAFNLKGLADYFKIEAVITKPRLPHHKGSVPVIEAAEELGLRVLTATDKKSLDELFKKSDLTSPVAVLVDFGIIVSQEVIDYFPLGIINSHFSLLPQWRGADPITSAVLSGQKTTGISLMLLTAGLDEGPLLAQTSLDMPEDITTPDLTDSLNELSVESLKAILPVWINQEIEAVPQELMTLASVTEPSYSRKLTKSDSIIDWNKPAERLEREIRAYIEWPRSHTNLAGLDLVITKAHAVKDRKTDSKIGQIMINQDKTTIEVSTSQGSLCIERLKPNSKPEMTTQAFLAGYESRLKN